ncbi:MAG: DUF433 domain-containing protein [Acidobacteria bacterium]|nr:MAG: DUF433 domain-containing protein [Acidobacteriota bacterium]
MPASSRETSRLKPKDYVYPHITKFPGVCGGRPAIDGTRVRVVNVVFLEKEGYTPEQMTPSWSPIAATSTTCIRNGKTTSSFPAGILPRSLPTPEDRHISKPAGWKPKR